MTCPCANVMWQTSDQCWLPQQVIILVLPRNKRKSTDNPMKGDVVLQFVTEVVRFENKQSSQGSRDHLL